MGMVFSLGFNGLSWYSFNFLNGQLFFLTQKKSADQKMTQTGSDLYVRDGLVVLGGGGFVFDIHLHCARKVDKKLSPHFEKGLDAIVLTFCWCIQALSLHLCESNKKAHRDFATSITFCRVASKRISMAEPAVSSLSTWRPVSEDDDEEGEVSD
jgi:hypothetical protein